MSQNMATKSSMFSLVSSQAPLNKLAPSALSKSQRPCLNCTCSPGLLSRQNKRTSIFMKQYSNRSGTSSSPKKSGSSESIYSSDSLCNTKNVNTTKRLEGLRNKLKENDLAVYIVPSEDEHQSEYVSAADQRRSFISGFTGSAGIAIITNDLLNFNNIPKGKSALSTDGRYFNQASQELDYNWILLKQGVKGEPSWQEWAINEAIEQSLGIGKKLVKIGVDPKLISYSTVQSFEALIKRKIEENGGEAKVELVAIKSNLVDEIWGDYEEVPKRPANELIKLEIKYSGEEFKDKLIKLRKSLADHQSNSILISALDEIAWFLNLRGSDIEYNPVFFSYLIVTDNSVKLFTNNPFSDDIKSYFKENNIIVLSYESIWEELFCHAKILKDSKELLSIPQNASWEVIRSTNNCKYKQVHSPLDYQKSVKNATELKNMEEAQIKDGVALIKYFSWLQHSLIKEGLLIDEYTAAEKLIKIREEQLNYKGNSFETISSTGANAAVIHYSPSKENSAIIDPSKIYLCDSGSQFLEGTTDITRTLHFSTPSKEEIDNYTLVLKGNLAIEQLKFPEGTNGYQIDVLARQFLWSHGLDYRHGTGHGVGSFLNVHEGPIGIGFRGTLNNFPLQKGNVITNEPGYYEDGKYGIRIENDMIVEATDLKFGDKNFLKFRNLTMVPYARNLINVKLLNKIEIDFLNKYNQEIFTKVGSRLEKNSIAYNWLKKETTKLP